MIESSITRRWRKLKEDLKNNEKMMKARAMVMREEMDRRSEKVLAMSARVSAQTLAERASESANCPLLEH